MKLLRKLKHSRLTMRQKLYLSLSAIASVLLISSIISVMAYSRMSTYVSGMIADNIGSINVAQKLSDISSKYNLDILAVIGDETVSKLPEYDEQYFRSHCDSLRLTMSTPEIVNLADSVEYSYAAYVLTSLELQEVLLSDFIDSRSWYFDRLQPRYNRLNSDINALSTAIYKDLFKNSATFDRGFYRSIIPGIVAVGVGLLMILMFCFYMSSNYVSPLKKMNDSLMAYRSYNRKYLFDFEGDDELKELNEGIKEIAGENIHLRKRLLDR